MRSLFGDVGHSLWSGFKSAARTLMADRLFAVAAILSIALGVGASTATFSIVNALWLRPLPLAEADRLAIVYFYPAAVRADGQLIPSSSWQTARQLRDIQGVSALTYQVHPNTPLMKWVTPRVILNAGAELTSSAVGHNYFEVLGVPVHGRTFAEAEDFDDTEAAIIGEAFARARFGGIDSALGQPLATSRGTLTVVGVAPRGFAGARLDERVEIWLPIGALRRFVDFPGDMMSLLPVTPIVKLTREASWQEVSGHFTNRTGGRAHLQPLSAVPFLAGSQGAVTRQNQMILVLWLTTLVVLLAGCTNLSSTLYARAEKRRHELAVRLAQGASRSSVTCLVAGEIIAVGLFGLVLSLLVMRLMTHMLTRYSLPAGLQFAHLDLAIDWRVASFAFAATVITLVLAAAMPLRHVLRTHVTQLLATARGGGDRTAVQTRQVLLFIHVALSLILVTAATALVAKVAALRYLDQGLAIDGIQLVTVRPSFAEYVSAEGASRLERDYHQLIQRIRGLPNVAAVAYGEPPLPRGTAASSAVITTASENVTISCTVVSGGPDYAAAVGSRVREGRDLTWSDLAQVSHPTAVAAPDGLSAGALIEQSLAYSLWPKRSAIGEVVSAGGQSYRIVGVIDDLLPSMPSRLEIGVVVVGRVASAQVGQTLPEIIVHTRGDSNGGAALSSLARAAFVPTPEVKVEPFTRLLERSLGNEFIGAILFSWFGTAAAILGIAGTYGLVAFVVARDKRALAIRAALGARRSTLTTVVMISAILPVVAGVGAGVILAYVASQLVDVSIVGLDRIEPSAFVLAAMSFLSAAAVASFIGAIGIRQVNIPDLLRTE